MKKFFAEPIVRLFLRALLVGVVAFASKWVDPSGHVSYSAAALRGSLTFGVLQFAEIFTPLNNLVGIFKLAEK
jgi:hypothetical protein